MNFVAKEPDLDVFSAETTLDQSKPGPVDPLEFALDAKAMSLDPRAVGGGWGLRHLMGLILVEGVLLWLVTLLGVIVVVGGIVIHVVAFVGIGILASRTRVSRQGALLKALSIAAEKGMPLAPAVAAFADQDRGSARRRVMALAAALNQGQSLSEALTHSRKLVSSDAVLLINAGEDSGQLPQALEAAASCRAAHYPLWLAIAGRFAYILALMIALQTIVSFILYFIVPKFEAIFRDFGVSLPQATVMVIDISHLIVKYFYLVVPLLILEVKLLIFLPVSLAGWGKFQVPIFDRFLVRRHSALLSRALALYVAAGRPISGGLEFVGEAYPTRWFRERVKLASRDVQQGLDWVTALERHQAIRPVDAEVLRSAHAVGNLGWALEEQAERNERRLAQRVQLILVTLFPMLLLMIGFVVFVIALGFFAPLVKLISELSSV